MTKATPTEPAFMIVLSEEELEDLGKFTAIISQIDFMMFQVIANASKIRPQDLMALIEGTTTGQRLSMLRRLAENMQNDPIRKKAEELCRGLAALNDKRNHILHGVWGLNWDFHRDTLKPACAYERNRDNPIFAGQLPELCERAAKLSLKVLDLMQMFNPDAYKDAGPPPFRFIFHKGPPPNRPAPEWQKPPSRRSSPPNPNPDSAK